MFFHGHIVGYIQEKSSLTKRNGDDFITFTIPEHWHGRPDVIHRFHAIGRTARQVADAKTSRELVTVHYSLRYIGGPDPTDDLAPRQVRLQAKSVCWV